MTENTEPLLRVSDFHLSLKGSDDRVFPVLEGISLTLEKGNCLGIAGESGSGKSVLALSLMGLIPRDSISKKNGSIIFDRQEITNIDDKALRRFRGKRLAMVFQEPMTAMNPLMTLFDQVSETVYAHEPRITGSEIEIRVQTALRRAGFTEPEKFYSSFPHQLSGGMRQRAMLAMALVMEPDLIIADEPTTALDAALQVQLLKELRIQIKERNHALIFISHDLGVIRTIADETAIMYAGFLVEKGRTESILHKPAHPYTEALLAAMPRLIKEFCLPKAIDGHLPAPDKKPSGCVFSDRCPRVRETCRKEVPTYRMPASDWWVKCFYPTV